MAQIRMEDFLSPTSNLTPGAVGALAVGISLPVAKSFGLSIPLILLVVSLLFAYLIIAKMDSTVPIPTKIVFFILNTLVIFSVSVGYGKLSDPPPQDAKIHPSDTVSVGINVNETDGTVGRFDFAAPAYASSTISASATTSQSTSQNKVQNYNKRWDFFGFDVFKTKNQ